MSEPEVCIRKKLEHLTSEQIVDGLGEYFVANSLWCARTSCTFLKAYIASGKVVDRGLCVENGHEYVESAIPPEPILNDNVTEQVQQPALSTELQVMAGSTSHAVIEGIAREQAAKSISQQSENLGEDLIGTKNMRLMSSLSWFERR